MGRGVQVPPRTLRKTMPDLVFRHFRLLHGAEPQWRPVTKTGKSTSLTLVTPWWLPPQWSPVMKTGKTGQSLRPYVEALGGSLRVVADFGDRQLMISD